MVGSRGPATLKAEEAAQEDGFRVDAHFFSCSVLTSFFSPGEALLEGSWEPGLLQKLEKLLCLSHLAVPAQMSDLLQSGGPTGMV